LKKFNNYKIAGAMAVEMAETAATKAKKIAAARCELSPS